MNAKPVLVLESVGVSDVPLIRRHLRRNFEVYHLNAVQPDDVGEPLRGLLLDGKVRFLKLQDYPYVNISPVANNAFEVADALYDGLFRDKFRIIRRMVRLYGSEDVHFAFKKHLLYELAEYFHCQLLRIETEKALPDRPKILFVPARRTDTFTTRYFDAALRRCGLDRWVRAETVGFPFRSRAAGRWAQVKKRFKPAAACVYTLLRAIPSFLNGLLWPARTGDYEFGITVTSPVREFANEVRGFDVLLDGRRIRKDNTLFIPVVPLQKEHYRAMEQKGCNVSTGPRSVSGKVFGAVAVNAPLALASSSFLPEWVFRVVSVALLDYLVWKAFLRRYRIGKFVTCGDFAFKQITRNILLKQAGVETWYYLDTENMGGLNYVPEDSPFRLHFWGYLYYDHLVAWSDRVVRYHRLHRQRIGTYHAVGCLWSEHIRMIHEGALPSRFPDQLKERGCRPGQKVVAVFDSSYNDNARTTYEDGKDFARGIRHLLDEMPDAFVVWKEKKPRPNKVAYHMLHWGKSFDELVALYDELSENKRCWFAGYDAPSAEILAFADVAISFPFTSPTVETLGARRKAVYFIPKHRYPDTYFEKIPGLVAMDEKELVQRVRELLHRTTPQEHEKYLDETLKGKIAPYLDGQALTRFRDLLSRNLEDQASSVRDAVNS